MSHGNRDLHTRRSVEIPYVGALLCAERTSEHVALYEESIEAVFWCDVDECALQCRRLLGNEAWRESVRAGGIKAVLLGGFGSKVGEQSGEANHG